VASKLEICNMALAMLSAAPISAFEENSAEAMAVNIAFDPTFNAMLSQHPWSFATKVMTLAEVDEDAYEFQHVYELPADCHTPIGLIHNDDEQPEFKVRGRKIYSDASPLVLEYVRDVNDTGILSGNFIVALASSLAAVMAPRLGAVKLMSILQAQAANLLRTAKATDARLTNRRSTANRTFVNARR